VVTLKWVSRRVAGPGDDGGDREGGTLVSQAGVETGRRQGSEEVREPAHSKESRLDINSPLSREMEYMGVPSYLRPDAV
jgi:hypothetical protein